jgi:hypothetical protein
MPGGGRGGYCRARSSPGHRRRRLFGPLGDPVEKAKEASERQGIAGHIPFAGSVFIVIWTVARWLLTIIVIMTFFSLYVAKFGSYAARPQATAAAEGSL